MRKTLLLTTVIVLAAGIVFAWAGEKAGVNSSNSTTDELITNIAPDQVLQAKLAAEEPEFYEEEQAELAREEALLATQPKRVGVSSSNVNPNPSERLSDQEKAGQRGRGEEITR